LVGDDSCTTGSHRQVKLDRGTMLGRYVLLERVGAGGMGVVYAAYDPELDRRVALKVLKGDAYGDVMASRGPSRLLREAQAMAKLAHPNVVTVHDVGTLGREVFIAMEYIDGPPLRAWLRERPRSCEEIVDVFAQAGRGLAAAHAEALVHRDFKPDNVLVAGNGRVVVTDFGLARRKHPEDVTTQASHPGASATARVIRSLEDAQRTAGAAGTPAYMAPEQHTHGRITEATDQFSFCVALYEALYEQHPFRGSDPVSLSTAVVDNLRRSLPAEANRVPRRIRRAIERGLHPNPDRRWPSMRALLAQLGPGPTAARRKWIAMAVGGLGAASALGMWLADAPARACRDAERHLDGIWDNGRRAEVGLAFQDTEIDYADTAYLKVAERLDTYAERWVEMRTQACEATAHGEQSDELLDRRMHCLDSRRAALQQLVDVLATADAEIVTRGAQAVLDLPSIDPCADVEALQRAYPAPSVEQQPAVEEAQTLRAKAEALHSAGKLRDALVVAADALRKAEASEYAAAIAWARHTLSIAHGSLGNREVAESLAMTTLVEARAASDLDLEALAWLQWLRVVSEDPRRHGEARRWVPVVRSAIARVGEPVGHASVLEGLEGSLAAAAGDYDTAATRLEQALALAMEAHGPESPQVATMSSRLAVVLSQAERTDRAVKMCSIAFDRLEGAFGARHPELMAPARACGALHRALGDHGHARELYGRAHAIAVETYGPRHEEVARAIEGQAGLQLDAGAPAEAETMLRNALEIAQRTLGEEDALTATIRCALARSLRAQGRLEEAREHASRAVALLESVLGDDHPDVAIAREELALVNAALGGFG
jgi:tetratricopeptide (TPR) repeat protein/predicted Ser/Thr protein kinase